MIQYVYIYRRQKKIAKIGEGMWLGTFNLNQRGLTMVCSNLSRLFFSLVNAMSRVRFRKFSWRELEASQGLDAS
jgi:hypothetical protein